MRDPDRIPADLNEVERLWRLHPDWRLGQLICNIAAWADSTQNIVWDMEDDVLVAEVQQHLRQQLEPAEADPERYDGSCAFAGISLPFGRWPPRLAVSVSCPC